jgi:hypothetical protein
MQQWQPRLYQKLALHLQVLPIMLLILFQVQKHQQILGTRWKEIAYPIYIDSTDDFTGNGLAAYYGSANSPLEFINYDELLFIEAEATLRSSGNIPAAQVFYDSAITVDMQKVGVAPVDIATYLVANGTLPGTVANAISQVAFQEYLALYLNPEAWVVWRRTNSPVLVPVSGTAVPRRFEYPQSEYDFNTANTPASTMFAPKIFWDN